MSPQEVVSVFSLFHGGNSAALYNVSSMGDRPAMRLNKHLLVPIVCKAFAVEMVSGEGWR